MASIRLASTSTYVSAVVFEPCKLTCRGRNIIVLITMLLTSFISSKVLLRPDVEECFCPDAHCVFSY